MPLTYGLWYNQSRFFAHKTACLWFLYKYTNYNVWLFKKIENREYKLKTTSVLQKLSLLGFHKAQ